MHGRRKGGGEGTGWPKLPEVLQLRLQVDLGWEDGLSCVSVGLLHASGIQTILGRQALTAAMGSPAGGKAGRVA